MNYPEILIRKRLFYLAAAATLIALTQAGIIEEPLLSSRLGQGSQLLVPGLLFVLLVATAAVMLRAQRLETAEAKMRLASGLDRLVFEHSPVGMLLSSADGRVTAVNAAYSALTGFSEAELLGRLENFQQAGSLDGSSAEEMNASLFASGVWKGEVWVRKHSGEALGFKVSRIALLDGERAVQAYLTLCQEASSGSEAQRVMVWQARHDTLTKLPNGNLFRERLSRFLLEQNAAAQRAELTADGANDGAVLSINLDGFAMVNDSMGFAAGDQVLTEAVFRIASAVRQTDTVARLGGDKFAVLFAGSSRSEEIAQMASSVVQAMSGVFRVRGRELFVTASVGVNVLPVASARSVPSPGEVMQRADSARIRASRIGGNRALFYEPAMNAQAQARYELESSLRSALPNNQFELYYQPLVDQKSGTVVSFEGLLRWHHPKQGFVSPADFIPLAEETGLIVDIGLWVVEQAHARLRRWAESGFCDLRLSINISTRQLRDTADIERLIDALRAPETERLTLEITESLLVADKDLYRDFLRQARGLGASIALDDFGTGYSSLSHLRDYRFDVLKIDRSFISALDSRVERGKADRDLVASIVSLGQILNLEVVAEGVEEASELKLLAELGCTLIQGYYYSAPMTADDAANYLISQRDTGLLRRIERNPSE